MEGQGVARFEIAVCVDSCRGAFEARLVERSQSPSCPDKRKPF